MSISTQYDSSALLIFSQLIFSKPIFNKREKDAVMEYKEEYDTVLTHQSMPINALVFNFSNGFNNFTEI